MDGLKEHDTSITQAPFSLTSIIAHQRAQYVQENNILDSKFWDLHGAGERTGDGGRRFSGTKGYSYYHEP